MTAGANRLFARTYPSLHTQASLGTRQLWTSYARRCFRPLRVSSYELKPRRSQFPLMKLNGDNIVCTAAYTSQNCFSRFGRDKVDVCRNVHRGQRPAAAVHRSAWTNKYSSDLQVLPQFAARLQDVLKNRAPFHLSVCDQVRNIKVALIPTACRPPRHILPWSRVPRLIATLPPCWLFGICHTPGARRYQCKINICTQLQLRSR